MRLRSYCRDELGGFESMVSRWLYAVTERERSPTVLRAVLTREIGKFEFDMRKKRKQLFMS